MLADPPHLSSHQRTPSPPPLSSSCSFHRSARLKTSNPSYHRNQKYSIIGLTNAAGTLVERYSYTAYGTLGIYGASGTVRTSSTYANRYTYTGREYDADLNLYHFRARWYDLSTGGFISRDPLGYVDGMSLYRGYFGVNGGDPFGHFSGDQIDLNCWFCAYSPVDYQKFLDELYNKNEKDGTKHNLDDAMKMLALKYLNADKDDYYVWNCKIELYYMMVAMYRNYGTGPDGNPIRLPHFSGWVGVVPFDKDNSVLSHLFGGAGYHPGGHEAQDAFERMFKSPSGYGPGSPTGDWHTDTAGAYLGNDFIEMINLHSESKCRYLMKEFAEGTIKLSTLFPKNYPDEALSTDWEILTTNDTTFRIKVFAAKRLSKFLKSVQCGRQCLLD